MALVTVPLPYGLRDIKVTSYTTDAATVLSTPSVDLPYARTLSFSAAEEFEELRGDDHLITTRGSGENVDWELESGGYSFEAVKIMYGGTVTETGTTPAQKKQLVKKFTDVRPFFKVEGQAISDSGGDFHVELLKCRATGELEGELGDGAFWLTAASGIALPSTVVADLDTIYKITQNETAVANT